MKKKLNIIKSVKYVVSLLLVVILLASCSSGEEEKVSVASKIQQNDNSLSSLVAGDSDVSTAQSYFKSLATLFDGVSEVEGFKELKNISTAISDSLESDENIGFSFLSTTDKIEDAGVYVFVFENEVPVSEDEVNIANEIAESSGLKFILKGKTLVSIEGEFLEENKIDGELFDTIVKKVIK